MPFFLIPALIFLADLLRKSAFIETLFHVQFQLVPMVKTGCAMPIINKGFAS